MPRHRLILISILILSAFLRLWSLGSAELTFDEGLYSFRSIGWLDYLESPFQTTPIQWLADKTDLPVWLKLSFHDHPPLFFLLQKISFSLLGDTLFASRVPSALFGIGFVYLIYLISKKIFKKESAGLISAFITGISFAHVSVSRLAMMESVLFFFIILNFYYFLKFIENKKYWWQFGLTFGLAMLTKYIAVFLIPTYLVYLLISNRDIFKNHRLYISIIVAVLIFSPVIIYNIYSYKTFGHFDLQFSYLLHQKTPWPVNDFGGKTQDPFSKIGETLPAVFPMPILIFSFLGLIVSIFKKDLRKQLLPVLIMFVFITLLLMQTGSAIRFVSLYIIPFVFFVTALAVFLTEKSYKSFSIAFVLAAILLTELYLIAFSKADYGVVKLDKYFDSVFQDNRPTSLPTHPNPYLNNIIQEYSQKYPATLGPTGIVYDDNISLQASLWLFSRRQYYHGIPIMPASNFENIIEKNGQTSFSGFTLYFVKAEEAAPLKPTTPTNYAQKIETLLQKNNQKPAVVITGYGANDIPTFKVYKFSLK